MLYEVITRRRAERDEQRQEMLLARVRAVRVRRLPAIVEQCVEVARDEARVDPSYNFV